MNPSDLRKFNPGDGDPLADMLGGLDSLAPQRTIRERVSSLAVAFPFALSHDSLLVESYHIAWDNWLIISEIPNHLVYELPPLADREQHETAACSIVRARREIERSFRPAPGTLENRLSTAWENERQYHDYLESARSENPRWDNEIDAPGSVREQVALILSQYPRSRDSDPLLLQLWREFFAGWRPGENPDFDSPTMFAVPKAYHWLQTTPETVTDARRALQRQGFFESSASARSAREQKEREYHAKYSPNNAD